MISVVETHIVVDLICNECGHEWQEECYEDHIFNAISQCPTECPKCSEIEE